jgi:uncharacterized protein (TIGR02996 family)
VTGTAPHPDEAAFLRAICAEPADDTPRLVYADWLEEHGQGERAEFIRVQVELAAMGIGVRKPLPLNEPGFSKAIKESCAIDPVRGAHLAARQSDLWNYGAPGSWVIDDPTPFDYCVRCIDEESISASRATHDPILIYRRGFVSHVTCTAAQFLEHGDALLARHPVTDVALATLPELTCEDIRYDRGYAIYTLTHRDKGIHVFVEDDGICEDWDGIGGMGIAARKLLEKHWPRVKFNIDFLA